MKLRLGGAALVAAVWSAAALAPAARADDTVWLCKPGVDPDPCRESLETTVYGSDGTVSTESPALPGRPQADCFYVYPTVSQDLSTNSDLSVDPEEAAIAEFQAARFSHVCRVFAPMYRQRTLASIYGPPQLASQALRTAFADVRAAWLDYLRHYNHGRGVILIGHSQGTTLLRELVRTEIDPKPAVRRRLISGFLLGANVTVKTGRLAGGDFRHVRGCTRATQTGCVVAFSTFNRPPPPNTRFGKPASPTSVNPFGFPSGPGYEVLCTDPGRLAPNKGPLETLLPSKPFPGVIGALLLVMFGGPPPSAPTPWVRPQDHYTGDCVTSNDANVLIVSPVGDARTLNPSPTPDWGLHLADANIALGDLVKVAGAQIGAYLGRPR